MADADGGSALIHLWVVVGRPMSESPKYEIVIVGGGPEGLTTALYTTRLGHRTAVFDKQGGRHTAVSSVHNLLGVSEDISGWQLSELAVRQLEEYGILRPCGY